MIHIDLTEYFKLIYPFRERTNPPLQISKPGNHTTLGHLLLPNNLNPYPKVP